MQTTNLSLEVLEHLGLYRHIYSTAGHVTGSQDAGEPKVPCLSYLVSSLHEICSSISQPRSHPADAGQTCAKPVRKGGGVTRGRKPFKRSLPLSYSACEPAVGLLQMYLEVQRQQVSVVCFFYHLLFSILVCFVGLVSEESEHFFYNYADSLNMLDSYPIRVSYRAQSNTLSSLISLPERLHWNNSIVLLSWWLLQF